MTNDKLPDDLPERVANTPNTPDGAEDYFKGGEETAQDALDEAQSEIVELKAKNALLAEDNETRKTALRFARAFLCLIPLVCLGLFLSSGLERRWTIMSFDGGELTFALGIEIYPYTQVILIAAPIAFVAAILVALLKGAFRSRETEQAFAPRDVAVLLNLLRSSGPGSS